MDDGFVGFARHKLSVDDYYRMADAGILGRDDRVELIDGELIEMSPIGPDHAATVDGLNYSLVVACGTTAIVSPQNPVRLDGFNEPQPDFAVFFPRIDKYRRGPRPSPAETLLVVEVADSSIRYDQTIKLKLYAKAGIAEYWIVDLHRRVLLAHRQPEGDAYTVIETFHAGDRVALSKAPGISVVLDRVFD